MQPTLSIRVGGTSFVYRDIGPRIGVPLILLNHWGAVLEISIRGSWMASPASIV